MYGAYSYGLLPLIQAEFFRKNYVLAAPTTAHHGAERYLLDAAKNVRAESRIQACWLSVFHNLLDVPHGLPMHTNTHCQLESWGSPATSLHFLNSTLYSTLHFNSSLINQNTSKYPLGIRRMTQQQRSHSLSLSLRNRPSSLYRGDSPFSDTRFIVIFFLLVEVCFCFVQTVSICILIIMQHQVQ